jgi:hypothetical protein
MWSKIFETSNWQSFRSCQELEELWSLLGCNLRNVANKVKVLGRFPVETMIRLNILDEFLLVEPLVVGTPNSTDNILKLTLVAT